MLIYDCDAPQLVVYDFWWQPLAKFQCVEDLIEKTKLTREEVSYTMNTSRCVLGLHVEFDRDYVEMLLHNEGKVHERFPMTQKEIADSLKMTEGNVFIIKKNALKKLKDSPVIKQLAAEGWV